MTANRKRIRFSSAPDYTPRRSNTALPRPTPGRTFIPLGCSFAGCSPAARKRPRRAHRQAAGKNHRNLHGLCPERAVPGRRVGQKGPCFLPLAKKRRARLAAAFCLALFAALLLASRSAGIPRFSPRFSRAAAAAPWNSKSLSSSGLCGFSSKKTRARPFFEEELKNVRELYILGTRFQKRAKNSPPGFPPPLRIFPRAASAPGGRFAFAEPRNAFRQFTRNFRTFPPRPRWNTLRPRTFATPGSKTFPPFRACGASDTSACLTRTFRIFPALGSCPGFLTWSLARP